MRIGLAYDLKSAVPLAPEGHPEDALEEYDGPETIEGIAGALQKEGHTVLPLGGGREFLGNILKERVDFVFNISEGMGHYRSREAQVPSILEMLDIPYTGADPQCLAVCLDKPLTKKLVSMEGIVTPRWQVIRDLDELRMASWEGFPFPAFVKPASEGSSKGVRLRSRVEQPSDLFGAVGEVLSKYHQAVMVEEFIEGDEITAGVVGNSPAQVLGIMRVVPRKPSPHFVYSLEVKRDWQNLVDYECPAALRAETLGSIEAASLKIYSALGCRDFARIDFRVAPDGTPYFLEINPLAGLNPVSSDLPIMARKMGWTYDALVLAIFHAALGRYPPCARA